MTNEPKPILIACGMDVVRVEIGDDFFRLIVMCQGFSAEENYREPASSSTAIVGAEAAKQIIEALSQKLPGKQKVSRDQH